MARSAGRIRGRANLHSRNDQRGGVVSRGDIHRVGYYAEKNLGGEDLHRRRRRVFGLVLGRAAGLASSAPELVVCCYSKLGIVPFRCTHYKIIIERGL